MKIVFLIRHLSRGGAERQLVTLGKGLRERGHDVSVAVFYGGGDLQDELASSDIQVRDLEKRGRRDIYPFLNRLRRYLRSRSPDVVYSCLAGSNICAALLRPFMPRRTRLVFRIAASYVNLGDYDLVTRLSYWLEARCSALSSLVIANSRAGGRYAARRGFPAARIVVVPNGFDVNHYRRDEAGGAALRRRWGVPDGAGLVGLVARLDPIKDHATFLKAAAAMLHTPQDVRFVCIGTGAEPYSRALRQMADEEGLTGRVVWAGEHREMQVVYSALDIATCSSYAEGFPNVVGEAMACETPCVVTDVGDAAWIVGDTGEVVAPGSPEALAQGWRAMFERLRKEGSGLGRKARRRIVDEFSEDRLVATTESILDKLARNQPVVPGSL